MVAGAISGPGDEDGSAYIFVRNPSSGMWTQQQKLRSSDSASADLFGTSASICGDTIVVGAPGNSVRGNTCRSAYVFKRIGATWIETAHLVPSDPELAAGFGESVAAFGDSIAVGASAIYALNGFSWPVPGVHSGAAYVHDFNCAVPMLLSEAGPDQSVDEGAPVELNGSGSGSRCALTCWWTQIAGPPVLPTVPIDPCTVSFIAPYVGPEGAVLTFQLVVSDGYVESEPDTVDIMVKNVNRPPEAICPAPLSLSEGEKGELKGAGRDPDGDSLTCEWTCDGLVIDNPTDWVATFTAPSVSCAGRVYTAKLTVRDPFGGVASCEVAVEVKNVPRFVRGDFNADGRVDLGDAVKELSYLLCRKQGPTCFDAADANDDGKVDICDPIRILAALFGCHQPLPLPYPTCGKDPTADGLSCNCVLSCE